MSAVGNEDRGPSPGSVANANIVSHLGATRTFTKIWAIVGAIVLLLNLVGFIYSVFHLQFPGGSLSGLAYAIIWVVVDLLLIDRIGGWVQQLRAGQYQAAKEPLLVWTILTVIFGVIPGILLLVAYIRILPWSDSSGPSPSEPIASSPAVSAGSPPAPPAGPPPPAFCPACGAPVVGQGRYCARCGTVIPPS